jgi:putative oxidoreductase
MNMTEVETREPTVPTGRSSAITRVVRVLLAVVFIYVGTLKLLPGGGMWIRLFDQIGIGQWFRFVTAGVEILAGSLMLFPTWSTAGAMLAIASMVGALVVHATVTGFGPQTVAVSILMAGSAFVGWSGRRHAHAVSLRVTQKRLIGALACLVVLYMAWNTLPGQPFDLTGRWTGRTLTGLQIALELKADGSHLSGIVTRNRRPSPFTQGVVTADGLSFTARLGRRMEGFSGRYLQGERIRVTLDSQGVLAPLTAVTFRRESPRP